MSELLPYLTFADAPLPRVSEPTSNWPRESGGGLGGLRSNVGQHRGEHPLLQRALHGQGKLACVISLGSMLMITMFKEHLLLLMIKLMTVAWWWLLSMFRLHLLLLMIKVMMTHIFRSIASEAPGRLCKHKSISCNPQGVPLNPTNDLALWTVDKRQSNGTEKQSLVAPMY